MTRRRDDPFEITVHADEPSGPEDVEEWAERGVDRLVARSWTRIREAPAGLAAFATRYELGREQSQGARQKST